jgi:ketosteroid isomerase-like protein
MADISASGDLAIPTGRSSFCSKAKDGKPTVSHGKYASIWKKQKTVAGRSCSTWETTVWSPRSSGWSES